MSDRTGQQIGNYRLVSLLGSGGFADVYLGQNIHIRKKVAIKILQTRLSSNELISFQQEAQTIEQLTHPNIVQILDFGITNNVPYLVMNYAPYGTLRNKHPKGSIVPLATVVEYVKQIAEALQYAHDNKIIHRDLKPENLLLGENNNILLSDFGIAAVAHGTASLKNTPFAGTLPYVAPEQIQGQPRPASDQYALGIMVYEWLTGTRPFNGTATEIVTQHLSLTPRPLREIVSSIPVAVEAVVMKALAKNPKQRFQSVHHFAFALEDAYQQPVTPIGTTICSYRDHIACINSVAWSPDSKFIVSSDDESVHVWEAMTGKLLCTYPKYGSAVEWSPNGDFIASIEDHGNIAILKPGRSSCVSMGNRSGTSSLCWSPDSKFIAVTAVVAMPDESYPSHVIQVWEVATGNLKITYGAHGNTVNSIAWSPDGRFIASGSSDSTVCTWDTYDRSTYYNRTFSIGTSALSIAWSLNNLIAVGEKHGGITIFSLSIIGDGQYSSGKHGKGITSITWSPDGRFLASGDWKESVKIWEVVPGRLKHVYTYGADSVHSIAWSPDGRYIASGNEDRTVHVWQAI